MKASQRRHGGWGIRRGTRRITGGAPVDLRLLRFADGDFTRGTAATYQTSASTIASVGSNVLRWEDRGDGNGAVALFEGGSTNLVVAPKDVTASDWLKQSGSSVSANTGTAPDGTATADDLNVTAVVDEMLRQPNLIVPPSGPGASSGWARVRSGTHDASVRFIPGIGGVAGIGLATLNQSWQRLAGTTTDVGTTGGSQIRFVNDAGVVKNDIEVWGFQHETLPFPTSYIDLGPSTARAPDVLEYPSAAVPAAMLAGRFEFDVYPQFASTESAGSEVRFFSFYSPSFPNDGLLFANQRFGIRIGNVGPAFGVVSFSRHQKITLSFDLAAGFFVVSGATTGNGTRDFSSTIGTGGFPAFDTLYVGSRNGIGASFARISEPRVW